MGKPCILMVGVWKNDQKGRWEFEIDKGKMSRLVYIEETWSYEELRMIAAMEFGEDDFTNISLSYWVPGCGTLSPPLKLVTDAGVKTFLRVLAEQGNLNLFVTIQENDDVEDSFCTPLAAGKRLKSRVDGEICLSVDGNEPMSLSSGRAGLNNCASTPPVEICVENNDFLNQIKAAEEEALSAKKIENEASASKLFSRSFVQQLKAAEELAWGLKKKRNEASSSRTFPTSFSCPPGGAKEPDIEEFAEASGLKSTQGESPSFHLFDDSENENENVYISDVDEAELRPRGYDKEFWEPLLEEQFGGSNAVEIMCETNNAFDHRVRIGGPEIEFEFPKVEGEFPPIPNSNSGNDVQNNANFVGVRVQRRALGDVADEEFDIPPLFDDLSYEMSEIPDLKLDEQDEDIYVGKTFGSKSDCQIALAIFAIKNMFHFKQTRTKKNYFVVSCSDPNCDWRVNAHEIKDSSYYQIRKASLGHSCSIETRSKFGKLATSRVIAAMYRARLNNMGAGQRPADVQQILLEELRIPASYFKCWKAKETTHEDEMGNEEESYVKLEEYLHMLKLANPGTVAEIETEDNGNGGERFLYMFLAFGASIRGFRWIRPVLVIDGTHLVGKYKGVLLTASGQDGNFQVYPLAFAVVDSENDDSSTWFLAKVERLIADSPKLTIISDRNTSIYKALKSVFPQAHHGACIVHLARNVVSRFKSKGLSKLVIKAACAYRISGLKDTLGLIIKQNEECGKYLENIGYSHWTRATFTGDRYNLMTSNVAETLNNALRKGRKSPVTELIMFIQSMLTRWFSARRKKALAHASSLVTPEVDKVITNNLTIARGSRVVSITPWSYEVLGLLGGKYNVNLQHKQCSCKVYDKTKIPCGHALMAADSRGVEYGQVASEYYRTTYWRNAYEGIIQPHEDPRDGDIPDEIRCRVVLPPKTRRPSGRPKEKRIPSVGEFTGHKRKRETSNRCGRCGGSGHNRISCTNPI